MCEYSCMVCVCVYTCIMYQKHTHKYNQVYTYTRTRTHTHLHAHTVPADLIVMPCRHNFFIGATNCLGDIDMDVCLLTTCIYHIYRCNHLEYRINIIITTHTHNTHTHTQNTLCPCVHTHIYNYLTDSCNPVH